MMSKVIGVGMLDHIADVCARVWASLKRSTAAPDKRGQLGWKGPFTGTP
jgi:hypothetical protein